MMLSLDTAYRSFGGEVEASSTPTICRLSDSRRHQLWAIAPSLLHHVSIDLLRQAFGELKRNAAPGVDGLTYRDYEADLERNLEELHARVHRGAYRAQPSRRAYIPKPDGRQRPLAVATAPSNCTEVPSA